MPRQEHNKLVRDRIPEIIAKNGGVASVKTLDHDGRFVVALYKKVREELYELLCEVEKLELETTAKGSNGVLEELADVMEVMHALIRMHGFSTEFVEAKRVAKRHDRGGFDKRLFLEYVDEE